jgi:1,4-dihydroxy-2-naphthoate polyprenyltransferase
MPSQLRLFIRLSRPIFLLGAALVYALGAGIARYLGVTIDWVLYLLGQAFVSTLQLSAQYLNEYFDAPGDIHNKNRTIFSGGSGAIGPGKLSRNTALIAAATTLTFVASLTVVLLQQNALSPLVVLVMVLSFLFAFFYSVPPVRLAETGYGELTTSVVVANLVPAFAFALQSQDLHRLVMMSTFPLTALHLAMMIVFDLPDYASDLKQGKQNLLIRLGWQGAMTLHNLLILSAFLLLGIAIWAGLPWPIALPAFLPLPLGFLQIWQMRRIAAGAKPNWTTLVLTAVVIFASMAYLLAFAFWTR